MFVVSPICMAPLGILTISKQHSGFRSYKICHYFISFQFSFDYWFWREKVAIGKKIVAFYPLSIKNYCDGT